MFRILSIDGGGIRGIIPAVILSDIERRTGRRIHQLFDLIVGTSTGGILALGLVKPGKRGRAAYSAADLVTLYETDGRRIFSRSVLHQILSLGNLRDKKYQSAPINKVLEEYFGEVRLSEALNNVMLASYDIQLRKAFFFRSYRAKEDKDYDHLMRQAARATSAAPTYFEPETIKNKKGFYALIDGGLFANNPSMCALVDAMSTFKQGMDQIFMVSLGTGSEQRRSLEYERVKNWGLVNWAQPILTVVFQGVSDTVDFQAGNILNIESSTRYHRLQVELSKSLFRLDNASAANIRSLRQCAESFINQPSNKDLLSDICKELTRKRPPGRKTGGGTRRARLKPVAGSQRPKRRQVVALQNRP